MKNYLLLLLISFSVLLIGCSQQKPVQAEFNEFYPAGSIWKEKRTFADGSQDIFEFQVLRERTFEGKAVMALHLVGEDKIKFYDKHSLNFIAQQVDGKTVMASLPDDGRYQWPLEVGKKWTVTFQFKMAGRKSFPVSKHYEVEAFEKVTVPAGTFDAFRVRGISGKKVKSTILLWWAPEVNMTVKIEYFKGDKNIITYETVTLPTLG